MNKIKEALKTLLFPLLPAFQNKVRNDINALIKNQEGQVEIIDIGGRKSPYTIGLNATITILDKQPENEVQKSLNLGIDEKRKIEILLERSNVKDILDIDITSNNTSLKNKYDLALAIEVIEHVKDSEKMLENIYNALKPGGILYITTPNGDYIKNEPPNYNPDHIKHYKRKELVTLLRKYFTSVNVFYGIKMGKYWYHSLNGWSMKHPFRTLITIFCSLINQLESKGMEIKPIKTAHLFAIVRRD